MPEFRGYVNPADVKATPTFDWNTVIGNVQKSLTDSEAARQANRDKLEKDTNDTLTAMSKITLGKDEALNQKLTDAAYNYKDAVGNYAKMVREGKAAQKDFNLFNQNAKDTFNQIDAVGKNAKAAYDTYIAETKAGNLSAASDYMAQTLGLAATLKDKNIILDPNTGRGFIAGKDPNDLVEVNWLNNERNLLVPKVKLDVELDAQADKIKDFTKYGKVGAGGVWTINDPTARTNFNEFENNVANGITSEPLKALSVLVDYGDLKGKRFTPTINKAEAAKDPSKIYVQLNASGNPEPVLTPEQDKIAKDTAKRYLRERLVYEQKQVENVWHGWAPDRSGDGKEPPVIPTTNDFVHSSGETLGGKYTPTQNYTMNVPVVDKATGNNQNLKKISINPVTKSMTLVVEEPKTVNGVQTVSVKEYYNQKQGDADPDLSKISNIARGIYDPRRRRYLKDQQELYDFLAPKAAGSWKEIQRQGLNQEGGAQELKSKGGISYTVE
jgi:hypothetical protein